MSSQRATAPIADEAVQPRGFLSVAQASERSGFSETVIRRAISAGRLVACQPSGRGGRILIVPGELARWLTTPAQPGPQPSRTPAVARRPVERHDGLISEVFDADAISRFAREYHGRRHEPGKAG